MKLIGKLIVVFVAVLIIALLSQLLFNFLCNLINPAWAQTFIADLMRAGIAVVLSFFVFAILEAHHVGIMILSFLVSSAAVFVANMILGGSLRMSLLSVIMYILYSIQNMLDA